jgi:hypothetical protein
MKIGILTFHRAVNYGAIFQAYALMSFLKRSGHQVEIIDYWPEYHANEYLIFNYKSFSKCSFKGKIRYLGEFVLKFNRTKKRNRGCLDFIYNNLHVSKMPKYLTGQSIDKKFDLIFYGSDQIWRKSNKIKENRGFDEVYLGRFPDNIVRKVSYAASMGVIDLNADDKDYLKRALKNFDSISVRERNLLLIVQELGYEAELTLDPVFLLDKEQWSKLIPLNLKRRRKKYILFYHHTPSSDAEHLTQRLSDQYGYEIIEVNSKVMPYAVGRKYKNTVSPGEFLGLIRDAEFVVATSFHGTVFSVLMQKQFFALGMGNNSERAKTFLDSIGLVARYLDKYNCEQIKVQPINYPAVNYNLDKNINNSMEFLMRNLCDDPSDEKD